MDDDIEQLSLDERQRQVLYERGTDPVRVLALSDGVFAIVITLLVLEIHVPDLGRGQTLGEALGEIRPSFIAFIISFVVVAIAWAGHRALFALIRRTDRALVWFNILYLLPLSILPFGASLTSRYDTDPVALTIYGMLLVGIVATRLTIWWYATGRPHLLIAPVEARARTIAAAIVALRGLAYVVAIVIASRAPAASLAIYALVPFVYLSALVLKRNPSLTEPAAGDIA